MLECDRVSGNNERLINGNKYRESVGQRRTGMDGWKEDVTE